MFACQQEEATTMLPATNFSVESNKVPGSPMSNGTFNDPNSPFGLNGKHLNLRTKLDQDRAIDTPGSTNDTFTPNSWKTGQSSLEAR